MAMRLFSPCLSQGDSMSPYIYGGKTIIKYFTSHSLKIHCSFQPLTPLQWKYKTHFLWSAATQNLGKSCGISKYHGTIFSVHKTFFFIVGVYWPSLAVGFVHAIDPKRSLKQHRKALESYVSWQCWGMRAENANFGGGMRQNVPTQLAVCCFPLSEAFSQTNMLNYLDNQGILHPHIYLQGFCFPSQPFSQEESKCAETRPALSEPHIENLSIKGSFL